MSDYSPTTVADLRAKQEVAAEVAGVMDGFERDFSSEVSALGTALAERVESRGGTIAGVEGVIRRGVQAHRDRFEALFAEGVADGARAGRRSMSREYGLDVEFETVPPETLAALEETVATLTGPILATLTEGIVSDVTAVTEEGGGVIDVASVLRDLGSTETDKLQNQGPTHAQTLIHGAAQRGGHSAMKQDDEVVGEKWNTVQDGRQRRTHENANGQIAPPGVSFLVGNSRLLHPGDPSAPLDEIINCRCLTTPVRESDLNDQQLATLRLGRTIRT